MKAEDIDSYLEPSKFPRILEEIKENLDNIKWDGQNLYITKHELKWRSKDKDVKKWMGLLFAVNNEICNEYRKRYGIVYNTEVLKNEQEQ